MQIAIVICVMQKQSYRNWFGKTLLTSSNHVHQLTNTSEAKTYVIWHFYSPLKFVKETFTRNNNEERARGCCECMER
jgi:hypothetical protein